MVLDDILKAGDLVFDIGANTGAKTDIFLGYGVEVVCIEPQKDCLIELKVKFQGNSKVTILPVALSSDGSSRMFRQASASTLSTFSEEFIELTRIKRFKNYEWGTPVEISTVTIDSIIKTYGIPNFCKIDVEGSEVEILKGLSYQIPYVSFEYTPEMNSHALGCMGLLGGMGRYRYKYSEGESLKFNNNAWLDKDQMSEYLLSSMDNIDFGDIYAKLEL
jgi:FkbM family methyltransferase